MRAEHREVSCLRFTGKRNRLALAEKRHRAASRVGAACNFNRVRERLPRLRPVWRVRDWYKDWRWRSDGWTSLQPASVAYTAASAHVSTAFLTALAM